MGFSTPPPAPHISMPPPAAHPAVLGSSTVDAQLKAQKQRAAAAAFTADNTIGTTPIGLTKKASTAQHTLLGQ